MGKHGPLKFGPAALVRYDCESCNTKNALHKKNVCIHCKNDRGILVPSDIRFTPRQLAHIRNAK